MEEKRKTDSKSVDPETGCCYHCGLPAENMFHAYIKDTKYEFCCNGCKTACELIYSVGADSYYFNRTSVSETPVTNNPKSFPYESSAFKQQYIQEKNGLSSVTLHLDNIHCASCIWVIEKVLGNVKGIKDVSVNFTTQKTKIIFDESQTSLESIINTLVRVGYPPTPLEKVNVENKQVERNKSLLLKMVIAAFATIGTMFLAEPFYLSYVQDLDQKSASILRYISLLISTPVFFYCVSPFFKGMITALKIRVFTMDSTIFIGAFLIYAYSFLSTVKGQGNIYYDCLNMFLLLILFGRLIEGLVQQKVFNKAGLILKNYPKQATIVKDEIEALVHIDEVKQGDIILVKPGEQIPVDGIIEFGKTSIDESLITGESKAVEKKEGDKVLGGSININGAIYFRVTRTGNSTTIEQIVKMVEDIGAKRTHLQSFADKTAHYFIIITLLIASLVYLSNVFLNPEQAMLTAISVIIVTCPCALGLAMPSAISLATATGIKKGVLFKTSDSFEKLNSINHVVLDKTGTVTTGKLEVSSINVLSDINENKLLEVASAIERYSEHPLAWAIVSEAIKRNVNLKKAHSFISYTGKGVSAVLDSKEYFIGSKLFLEEKGISIDEQLDYYNLTETIVYIADSNNLLGYILLKDDLKPNVLETINLLKDRGIKTTLLSGDKRNIAERVAKQIGVNQVISEVLPEDKALFIANLKKQGFKVAMVGDGINDAPAMAQSDIGIAIHSGNDLAGLTADIILLNEDFNSLNEAMKLSRTTYNFIKQNLLISLIYNIFAIPFAAFGLISPLIAAVLMPVSSLAVLSNSLRITRGK